MENMTTDELGKWHEQLVNTKNLINKYKETSDNGVLAQIKFSAMVLPVGRTEIERTADPKNSVYLELIRSVTPTVEDDSFIPTINVEESTPVSLKIYNGLDNVSINPIYMQELQTVILKIMDDVESTLSAESQKLQAEVEKSFKV